MNVQKPLPLWWVPIFTIVNYFGFCFSSILNLHVARHYFSTPLLFPNVLEALQPFFPGAKGQILILINALLSGFVLWFFLRAILRDTQGADKQSKPRRGLHVTLLLANVAVVILLLFLSYSIVRYSPELDRMEQLFPTGEFVGFPITIILVLGVLAILVGTQLITLRGVRTFYPTAYFMIILSVSGFLASRKTTMETGQDLTAAAAPFIEEFSSSLVEEERTLYLSTGERFFLPMQFQRFSPEVEEPFAVTLLPVGVLYFGKSLTDEKIAEQLLMKITVADLTGSHLCVQLSIQEDVTLQRLVNFQRLTPGMERIKYVFVPSER